MKKEPGDHRSTAGLLALDLRALALWRIGLGLVLLLDIFLRLPDLQTFYGDHGVLSREVFLQRSLLSSVYCLFLATGSTLGLSALFLVGALAALSLIVGYKTRWAGFVCWAFVVSIQIRNPSVMDGGDELLRLLLFWTPFLPLGARWSWDAHKNPHWRWLPNTYRSLATAGLYLQTFVLYFFAAHLKTGDDWRVTGEALYYAFSIDQFATPVAQWLLNHPEVLVLLTPLVLWAEYFIAGLLLLPWAWGRWLFLLLATGLHLGIASTLHLGIFMLITTINLLAFLPGVFIQGLFPGSELYGRGGGPPPTGYTSSWPTKIFLSFALFYIALVNGNSVKYGHRLPGWTMPVAKVLHLHQHWHLFAPYPFREDGWFVFEVTDAEGRKHDLFGEGAFTLDKPELGSRRFFNHRWRRWLQNSVQLDVPDQQLFHRETLKVCSELWKARNPGLEPRSYRLLFLRENTPPPGELGEVVLHVLATRSEPSRAEAIPFSVSDEVEVSWPPGVSQP